MGDLFESAVIDTLENKSDSDYKKDLLNLIYDTKNINVKTDLTQAQITAISRMELFASYYKVSVLDTFLQTFKELQISKDRQGRKEGTQILSSANQMDLAPSLSTWDKLVTPK